MSRTRSTLVDVRPTRVPRLRLASGTTCCRNGIGPSLERVALTARDLSRWYLARPFARGEKAP